MITKKRLTPIYVFGLLALTLFSQCKSKPELGDIVSPVVPVVPVPPIAPSSGTLMFKNGFEGTTRIEVRTSQHDNIRGSDGVAQSDWLLDLERNKFFGTGQIVYEQGDYSQRRAEVVVDPANPNNKVLRMRIHEKHITLLNPDGSIKEQKARIQYDLQNQNAPPSEGFLKEYYQKVRIYFSPNFSVLKQAGTDNVGWMIMQEFWNDPSFTYTGQAAHRPARTDVGLAVKSGKLHFAAGGRDPIMELPKPGNNSWHEVGTALDIPLGKWMTQEIYVKEGGSAGTANPGRFYLAITPDGGQKIVLVDKIGMTASEEPGAVHDGQSAWNPIKFYSEGRVLDWFKNAPGGAKTMDIYWDDLEIWRDRRPER
ncbi:hypothetical protein A5893_12960 [Pedobacter psychrophilus]|uniref:Uncharacterized protein n=1 Tax=Pedobacter psychrophilus TaxID=1826909 RepID=A0A179DDQ7_9SPHI|nr:hypothetical protein [Pedobacter psychrophilus]OAQ38942.1 hypothetical protein A5893_12960 [Pedobacter psychrophilus]